MAPRYVTVSVRIELISLALVAVLIVLNLIAAAFVVRWDGSPGGLYRLAAPTRGALARLDAPLRVLLFAERSQFPDYRDRFEEYDRASRRVHVEYVSVESEIGLVEQYDVERPGTAVLEYKGRTEMVDAAREQDFTNALIRLVEGRVRKAYFTTGHAERDTDSTERVGYSTAARALRHQNLAVEKINLAQRGDVPADAGVLVVAGPRADFFTAEIDAITRYLDRGGRALFMVDPFEDLKRYITETGMALFMIDPASATATGELRNLTRLIADRGVDLGRDVVVDTSEMGQFVGTDASVPIAVRYPPHPITAGLTSLTAFPMARSVLLRPNLPAGRAQAIAETSEKTWAESDLQQLASGKLSLDPGRGDRPGPVALAAALSTPAPGASSPDRDTRIVVVGDSDFIANYSTTVPGNVQLFLGAIGWLIQERMVEIPPPAAPRESLAMDQSQQRLVFIIAIVVLPALLLGIGLYLWTRRSGAAHEGGAEVRSNVWRR